FFWAPIAFHYRYPRATAVSAARRGPANVFPFVGPARGRVEGDWELRSLVIPAPSGRSRRYFTRGQRPSWISRLARYRTAAFPACPADR
ncbi:Hypothetical predicted protein, partial [Pelobates cultripes]